MPKNLTASDRSALIRMASSLPQGSPERKAVLAGLSKTAAAIPRFDSADDFIHFLERTLIPDLNRTSRRHGEDSPLAEDLQKAVALIQKGRRDATFERFLKKTLAPDLRDSGKHPTAQTVEEAVYWMNPDSPRLATGLNKVASAGSEIVWRILDQRAFMKVWRDLGKDDEQAADLLYEVLTALQDKLDIADSEHKALNRIAQLVKAGSGWKPALQRNNIFKAADLLGIRLPSGMFASQKTASKKSTLSADLKLKDGTVYTKGSRAEVIFSERSPSVSEVEIDGRKIKIGTVKLHRYLRGFPKPPSMSVLEKWDSAGSGTTVTGARGVAMDGYGSDGSPSWMLAMDMI